MLVTQRDTACHVPGAAIRGNKMDLKYQLGCQSDIPRRLQTMAGLEVYRRPGKNDDGEREARVSIGLFMQRNSPPTMLLLNLTQKKRRRCGSDDDRGAAAQQTGRKEGRREEGKEDVVDYTISAAAAC